jgi:large subunit ribosomal protein L18e
MEKISKRKIEKRLKQKVNPLLVEAIIKIKKLNPLLAKILATPKKVSMKINLEELNEICEDGENIIIPGKLLGTGELNKKIKIIFWSASESAIQKLEKNKIEFSKIYENLKDAKKLKEYRVLE